MYELTNKPVSELKPFDRNPKVHPPEQVKKIAKYIEDFGFTAPIMIDEDNVIIAGHGRLQAAKSIGLETVPTIIVSGLSEEKRTALRIADNLAPEGSEWDFEILSQDIKDLEAKGYNIDDLGFDDTFLADLVGEVEDAQVLNGDPDDAPGLSSDPPRTVEGDVWVLGKHRVMCGDSTSIDAVKKLMDGGKADMVFTDPPYGYKYESNHQERHEMMMSDDKMLDFIPAVYDAMLDDSSMFLCGSFQTISHWIGYVKKHMDYKNLIVWKKNNWSMGDLKGAFAGQHELIIYAHKGRVELIGSRDSDIWSFDREPPNDHPTQKPVDLIEYALSKVPSDRVLDVFGGSGSTLIACEKTRRKSFLMELDPKYCDVIIKRWQELTGKKAIHEDGNPFDSE